MEEKGEVRLCEASVEMRPCIGQGADVDCGLGKGASWTTPDALCWVDGGDGKTRLPGEVAWCCKGCGGDSCSELEEASCGATKATKSKIRF